MLEILSKLEFKNINQDGLQCWSKIYKGFILFIAKVPNTESDYLASITVKKVEISIPNYVDENWVSEFHLSNID